jgi:hypothetical protein
MERQGQCADELSTELLPAECYSITLQVRYSNAANELCEFDNIGGIDTSSHECVGYGAGRHMQLNDEGNLVGGGATRELGTKSRASCFAPLDTWTKG